MANIGADNDNNIIISKVEVSNIQSKAVGKRKRQELWDVRSCEKLVEEAQAMVDEEIYHETSREDNDYEKLGIWKYGKMN